MDEGTQHDHYIYFFLLLERDRIKLPNTVESTSSILFLFLQNETTKQTVSF